MLQSRVKFELKDSKSKEKIAGKPYKQETSVWHRKMALKKARKSQVLKTDSGKFHILRNAK